MFGTYADTWYTYAEKLFNASAWLSLVGNFLFKATQNPKRMWVSDERALDGRVSFIITPMIGTPSLVRDFGFDYFSGQGKVPVSITK